VYWHLERIGVFVPDHDHLILFELKIYAHIIRIPLKILHIWNSKTRDN